MSKLVDKSKEEFKSDTKNNVSNNNLNKLDILFKKKSQIVQIFPSSIVLEKVPIGAQSKYRKDIDRDSLTDYLQNIGKEPYIFFKGLTIERKDIEFFRFSNDEYFPKLELIFRDPTQKLSDQLFPFDGESINFFLQSRDTVTNDIRIDFTIWNFEIMKNNSGDNDDKLYKLQGYIDYDDLIFSRGIFGTSFEVLGKLAEIGSLGYFSNIDQTDDEMTWINTGFHMSEFIPDITLTSYKDDDSFLWSYIDPYYNLNFIDIEKQLQDDISEQMCISTDKFTLKDGEEEKILPLILTNDPDYNGGNLFIDKYRLNNDSFDTNWNVGYNSYIYYYDKNEKFLHNYTLDTISTVGKDQNQIIQKGKPDDTEYKLINRRNYYLGKIDTENVHKNYVYAYKQNVNNIKFLQKIKMNIVLKNLNFSLYRYQLVEIIIYNMKKLEEDGQPVTKKDKINQRLSGQWLITGINFVMTSKSELIQEITVVKRELTSVYKNVTVGVK